MSATEQMAGSVMLAGGISIPLPALRFCWDLEDRGCRLCIEGDGLSVGPRELLTDGDRAVLRRWRDAIRAVVAYCDRPEARQ